MAFIYVFMAIMAGTPYTGNQSHIPDHKTVSLHYFDAVDARRENWF